MSDRYTLEQRAAIQAQGKTIVSASAGSGKTTVMIEKIIRLIKGGCAVGEILAVTFTKKAAAQMKEKLCKALIAAINDKDTSPARRVALKKQLGEVPNAEISTIHSFCSRLIKTHFYAAGVDSAFRVIGGDDAEGRALKNQALDELLDEAYEEKETQFAHLLSVYWRKKSDNTLRNILLSTYDELRNRADYKQYLQNCKGYNEQVFARVCTDLLYHVQNECAYYLDLLETEQVYFEQEQMPAQLALCAELSGMLNAVLQAEDYFKACTLQKPKFTVNRSSKKYAEEKIARVKRLSELKTKIVEIYDGELLNTLSKREELNNFLLSGETAAALAKYLLRFDEKYDEVKNERGVLDYNDLEHKALALLNIQEVAKETRQKYRYVFVDEYQDVNPVQEEILSRVGGENVFLVGDVKQSIYGFRGSKSKFFLEKQKRFKQGEGASLYMTRNFRSADAVLDAVNTQFALAMTPSSCGVDYAQSSYMERGGRYALNDGCVRLHCLAEEEKPLAPPRGVYSVMQHAGKKDAEEGATAKTIRAIIEKERASKWYDADAGIYREVRYSDIAILSRKKQGQIAKTVAALAAEGIPVTAAAAVNICDYAEIKTLIDILSLLDNAAQDVPLCSALLSSMADMTADELSNIRLAYPNERFFRNACKQYAAKKTDITAHKLQKFYAYFDELKTLSCTLDVGELLTKLIADTRMEARLLSRDNGVACLKRIHRFIEETAVGEPLCLHGFLEHLRDLNYRIEFSENGGEDSVRVLTMHASKGLEYPVVIIDNLNAPFRGVVSEEVYVEEHYGLAPKAFHLDSMIKRDTLLRRLHTKREMESSVADELNLYYVALTRAKYSLHLIYKKPSAMQNVKYAKSFADFTDFQVWEQYVVKDELFNVPKQPRAALVFHPDETLAREVMQAFTWKYPHAGFENLPVKSSATALIAQEGALITEQIDAGFGKTENVLGTLFDVEDDVLDGTENTGKEAGIAYHAFLECFDFSLLHDERGTPIKTTRLVSLIKEVYEREKDKLPYAKLLSLDKLAEILSNPVFYRLRDMRTYKEQQFLVSLPITDTYLLSDHVRDKAEEMLFQGAIDLLAVGEDEIRIVDYKYSVKDAQYLKRHYAPQLNLYRMATAKILRVPIERIQCSIVNIYRGFQVDVY